MFHVKVVFISYWLCLNWVIGFKLSWHNSAVIIYLVLVLIGYCTKCVFLSAHLAVYDFTLKPA